MGVSKRDFGLFQLLETQMAEICLLCLDGHLDLLQSLTEAGHVRSALGIESYEQTWWLLSFWDLAASSCLCLCGDS